MKLTNKRIKDIYAAENLEKKIADALDRPGVCCMLTDRAIAEYRKEIES